MTTVRAVSFANAKYNLEWRWTGFYNSAFPYYDCRNTLDSTWQYAGINQIPADERSRYSIATFTSPQAVPPNYCSGCTYLTNGCVQPKGFCESQRIVVDGTTVVNGPGGTSYAVTRTCPQGGGDNTISYDRQMEIRWVLAT
jgi:hypothetical protein